MAQSARSHVPESMARSSLPFHLAESATLPAVPDSRRKLLQLTGAAAALWAFRDGLWRPAHAQPSAGPAKSSKTPAARPVNVTSVTYTQSEGYSRIVIECEGEPSVRMQELPKDPANDKTDRVLVDLKAARRGKTVPAEMKIEKGILLGVRTGQYDRETVRIVLDFAEMNNVGLTKLYDPFRVVLDIDGRQIGDLIGAGIAGKAQEIEKGVEPDSDALAALLPGPKAAPEQRPEPGAIGKPRRKFRVILDPGHGGKDPGAVGFGGLQEKNVALQVADRTGELLSSAGYDVQMTRTNDRFLELTERTAFANKKGGDLFVSIHCNAAKNREARGVETYYLNPKVDKSRALLIAKENFSSLEAVQRTGDSFADAILSDLAFSLKEGESRELAEVLLGGLWDGASGFPGTQNRGMGHGPLYVLIGARMPSSLVELSFISNPQEEKLLGDGNYQTALAQGLAAGVADYLEKTASPRGG